MNVLFYAFRGQEMCFSHILINAIDMKKKGMNPKIVIEGEATKTVKEMLQSNHNMLNKAIKLDIIAGVCKACSNQMGVLEYFENTDIKILDDLFGHPSLYTYIKDGYEIISL